MAAYDAGDYPKAYKIWSGIEDQDLGRHAQYGDDAAPGTGVAKDPKKAEELYGMAAEAGLPTRPGRPGDMLLKGEAGPPNPRPPCPCSTAAAAADIPSPNMNWPRCMRPAATGWCPRTPPPPAGFMPPPPAMA